MRSRTSREVPEWSGEYDSYKAKQILEFGIVSDCSVLYRKLLEPSGVGPTWPHLSGGGVGLRGSALAALGQGLKAP